MTQPDHSAENDRPYCLRCDVPIYQDERGVWRREATGVDDCPRNPARDGHEPRPSLHPDLYVLEPVDRCAAQVGLQCGYPASEHPLNVSGHFHEFMPGYMEFRRLSDAEMACLFPPGKCICPNTGFGYYRECPVHGKDLD